MERKAQASKHNWWVQLFKKMKTITSQSLPTDEKSMLQAIKQAHYQVYYLSRVDETIISDNLLRDKDWTVDIENEDVRPLWFTGAILISFLHFHSSQ